MCGLAILEGKGTSTGASGASDASDASGTPENAGAGAAASGLPPSSAEGSISAEGSAEISISAEGSAEISISAEGSTEISISTVAGLALIVCMRLASELEGCLVIRRSTSKAAMQEKSELTNSRSALVASSHTHCISTLLISCSSNSHMYNG